MIRQWTVSIVLGLACLFATGVEAEVSLPHLLSSHAVLQRERPIRIWGWAAPGEHVAVQFHGQSVATVADAQGNWMLALEPESAGGPYTLVVQGSNRIELTDILVGDVYLASGQSNMGYPLTGIGASVIPDSKEVIASAGKEGTLRLLQVPHISADFPQHDQPATWTRSSPESAAPFSALGYLFGQQITHSEHVPVGIISAAFGGTPIEAWISPEALGKAPELLSLQSAWAALAAQQEVLPGARSDATDPTIARKNQAAKTLRYPNLDAWRPSALYNAMIAPLVPFEFRGVFWYQGESSSQPQRAPSYADALRDLIQDWRDRWQQGDTPFFVVQLASYTTGLKADWGMIRDGQRRALGLDATALVVTLDQGDLKYIHYNKKRPVAERMALAAQALIYGEKVEFSGPLFREVTPDGHALRVWFDHAERLHPVGPVLQGFEVAAADGNFVQAQAKVSGNTVVVSSAGISAPRFVRYAWKGSTDANLSNGAGLPASTFTSIALPLPEHP
jgi:sialate O-acetylesterase